MEHRLTALETRLDTVLPTLATKGDVSDAKSVISEAKAAIIMWLSGTIFAAASIIIVVLIFAINRTNPGALPAQPAAQPIVIQLPAAPPTAPAPQPKTSK